MTEDNNTKPQDTAAKVKDRALRGPAPKLKRFDQFLTMLEEDKPIIEEWLSDLDCLRKTKREDKKKNLFTAGLTIIANLMMHYEQDADLWTEIPKKYKNYKASPINPQRLNRRAIKAILDDLESQKDPELVKKSGGNKNPETGQGYYSRYRLTEEGYKFFSGLPVGAKVIPEEGELKSLSGSRSSSKGTTEAPIGDTYPLIGTTLGLTHVPLPQRNYNRIPPPLIQLKDNEKTVVEFKPTEETLQMERDLRKINDALDRYWLDLLVPDRLFQFLISDKKDKMGSRKEGIDLVHRKTLYRTFNNQRFDNGGRFYGGWWMSIPSEIRKHITINWFPTVELDFSNMQIAMLYAKQEKVLENDAYELEGFPKSHRNLLKETLLKLINAEGKTRAPSKSKIPDGWNWQKINDALSEKHSDIAEYFGTGVGIELQRVDSDIANNVMLGMIDEGELVLPVHDSFIVREGYEDKLRSVMREEYQRVIGKDISIKEDKRAFPKVTAEEFAAYVEGVIDLADRVSQRENSPLSNGYRLRKRQILDEWRYHWHKRPPFLA